MEIRLVAPFGFIQYKRSQLECPALHPMAACHMFLATASESMDGCTNRQHGKAWSAKLEMSAGSATGNCYCTHMPNVCDCVPVEVHAHTNAKC